jgi:hypothetical protein
MRWAWAEKVLATVGRARRPSEIGETVQDIDGLGMTCYFAQMARSPRVTAEGCAAEEAEEPVLRADIPGARSWTTFFGD